MVYVTITTKPRKIALQKRSFSRVSWGKKVERESWKVDKRVEQERWVRKLTNKVEDGVGRRNLKSLTSSLWRSPLIKFSDLKSRFTNNKFSVPKTASFTKTIEAWIWSTPNPPRTSKFEENLLLFLGWNPPKFNYELMSSFGLDSKRFSWFV